MILRVERCDDVFMKNMKILILHTFLNDFAWKSCRGKLWTGGPAGDIGAKGERQTTGTLRLWLSGKPERDTNPKAICQYIHVKHENLDLKVKSALSGTNDLDFYEYKINFDLVKSK